jgi:hypothetical protein
VSLPSAATATPMPAPIINVFARPLRIEITFLDVVARS